ncbi:ParB/RepB/Spo0J family partition protein [Candidatus Falkowbacteria bacterium]|nr:ParB/RepB/Spo0J family partition protein [Candidatus Falkowbacteria bacterium]
MSYGLGRGLNSLIPSRKIIQAVSEVEAPSGVRLIEVPVKNIRPNPKQPREDFGYQDLEDLINSVKEHGILQPLVVTKIDGENYELIAGERRYRAAKFLNLRTVPAIVRTVRDQEKLELALIENIQRKNLNPIEEARAFSRLMQEFNLTQEKVAERIGKSRPTVANTLRLLSLPNEIQQALRSGKIKESHARTLVSLPDERAQLKYFSKILKNEMTVRDAEIVVRRAKGSRQSKINPALAAKEETLRGALGTKVEIKKRGERGQVIIYFYSEEELNNLIKKISKR